MEVGPSRRKERTRRAIHDAALVLFTEQGYGSTTVEDVAAAAGVSRMTVFRHFGSKDDLLFGEADRRLEELCDIVSDRPPESMQDLQDCVVDFAEQLARDIDLGVWIRIIGNDRTLLGRAALLRWDLENALARVLAEQHDGPSLLLRTLAANAIGAILMAALTSHETGGSVPDLVRRALLHAGIEGPRPISARRRRDVTE